MVSLSQSYQDVKFINLSMGALGVYSKSCNSFFSMMDELRLSEVEKKYIASTATNLDIRCSYYIFCSKLISCILQFCLVVSSHISVYK